MDRTKPEAIHQGNQEKIPRDFRDYQYCPSHHRPTVTVFGKKIC